MEFLAALSEWPVAEWLRRSPSAYPVVSAAHIFSIGLLVGSIITLDLRLIGFFRQVPVAAIAPLLSRVAACGVLGAVATGFLLFSVRPAAYAVNPAFLMKLALVALGIGNAAFLHFRTPWREVVSTGRVSRAVRASALASLLAWPAAILAGRWIAFVE
jgi:predicted membrane-bound spermidine synthase